MEGAWRLSDLAPGDRAEVREILGVGLTRLREMGVLVGTQVAIVRRAPLGDPIEISVRGALLSLRRREAEQIEVRKI